MCAMTKGPVGLVLLVLLAASAQAENRVTLEVITERGVAITAHQTWSKLLADMGFDNVTLRSGRSGEQVSLDEVNLRGTKLYKVKAILTTDQVLHLPGGDKFSRRNLTGLRAWVTRLKVGGEDELKRQPDSDGLTRAERQQLLTQLTPPVDFDTQGQNLADVLGRIGRQVNLEFRASPAIIAQAKTLTIKDELRGISSGTAMAVMLRAGGLALVPQREVGGEVHLHVLKLEASADAWPAGRKPEQSPNQVCPALFQFIEVEIKGTPLEEALGAIVGRLQTKVLRDHYTIGRDQIDTSEVRVRFPKERTFYKKILDHILFQAMLSLELRVDEAGTAILWITSAKRP